MKGKLGYSSNNSGGSWWLKDKDWLALEEAGWTVSWFRDQDASKRMFSLDKDGRWLGGLAKYASKEFDTPDEGVAEWEEITGQNVNDEGCNCCGEPHYFSFEDENGNHRSLDVEPVAYRRTWS